MERESNTDTTGNIALEDSLSDANTAFAKKLKYYAGNYPSTITQKFNALTADNLDISTSDDGLFRIYSWDTEGGGTEHEFKNVFQYRSGAKTIALLDTPLDDDDDMNCYNKLYTFKANNKTYYLAVYLFIESSRYAGQGIQVFSIENGKLNSNTKLIKTASGLHSHISYEYDFGSVVDIPYGMRPTIQFDATTQSMQVPLVTGNGMVIHKFITYKFTGKYFEKVKS